MDIDDEHLTKNGSNNEDSPTTGLPIDQSSNDDGEFGEFMDAAINPNKMEHAECGALTTRLDEFAKNVFNGFI